MPQSFQSYAVLTRCAILSTCALLFLCCPVQARSERYKLVQRPGPRRQYNRLLRLSLYDCQTGRNLWRRLCLDLAYNTRGNGIAWSRDGQALAVGIVDVYPGTQFRILYWRAGYAPRLLGTRRLFADFDAYQDMSWSPDAQRFSFIAGGSGALDVENGTFFCVNASTGVITFGPSHIDHYRWIGPRLVRYVAVTLKPDTRHPNSSYGIAVVHPARDWQCP